ncbi:hypothetical protein T02_8277 [Trichinella nativa]|uniref:Activin types I and II receptor domain-containing protein n=1 Tax=Trichinella nativa TaxID=6335 RepID=A0A0V1KVS2_9BILA|nr:hypothetical protein T02_8277 [Trichinella nativa]
MSSRSRWMLCRWAIVAFVLAWCGAGRTGAVKCFSCEGLHCVGDICEGQYCLVSSYASVWGQAQFGKATHVKGCVNGTLLRRAVRSHCEFYSAGDVKMCICDADYCNANVGDKLQQFVPFVRCRCDDGDHCSSRHQCIGEYCSYVVDRNHRRRSRGCVNRTVPLIERRGVGACVQPPITGATVHSHALHQSVDMETCLCAEDFCNEQQQQLVTSTSHRKRRHRCPTSAQLTWNDFPMQSQSSHCYGQHCFSVDMVAKQSATHYQASGCISFISEPTDVEELNQLGCIEFQSKTLTIKTCFNKEEVSENHDEYDDDDFNESAEFPAEQQHTEPSSMSKITQVTSETSPPPPPPPPAEGEAMMTTTTTTTTTTLHKKLTTAKHVHSTDVEEAEIEQSPPAEEDSNDDHLDELSESAEDQTEPVNDNTSLVVAFVVIMIIIAVGGLAWKCDLHKKIMHSRYQTVAGL